MIIIIVGYSGSNKIEIAKILAKKIKFNFFDLYKIIEENEKLSISQIINNKGDVYFRNLESKHLKQIVNHNFDLVLSINEGTPCYANNINYINQKNVVSIYLKYSIDNLLNNILNDRTILDSFPPNDNNNQLKEYIGKHLFERIPYYNKCKTIIDCDNISENKIVEKILDNLNKNYLNH